MTIEISPFDPSDASDRDLNGYFAMRSAAREVDFPEDAPLTYDAAIGRLRNPPLSQGEPEYWAAHVAGDLVGVARVSLPTDDNAGVVLGEVVVHPELRRRGIGTALLRAAMPAVLAAERKVVIAAALKPDGAGAAWVTGLGFTVTMSTVMQRLIVASVPPERWDIPVPDDYRLIRWIGAAPEEFIESYAAARPAVRDSPMGQSSYQETAWTAELIRETERRLAEREVEERVVVAVHAVTGAVVGVTGILNYPHRREFGYQNDTSVVAAHRGHGLGRVIKAAMMRWIVAERPDIERIMTTTPAENTHMINVNLAIGYRTVRTMIWAEAPPERLAEELAAGRPMS